MNSSLQWYILGFIFPFLVDSCVSSFVCGIAEGSAPLGSVFQKKYTAAAKEMTVREALNSPLDEEMSADPRVFLMGEEVGEYQGAYKISKGLLEKYGSGRVLDTPITEAIDHVISSAAKSNHMSAGQISVLIVFRGSNGATAGVGAQNSQVYGDPDPVVFLENELLYGESFPISAEVLDSSFCLPIGKAKIEREGKHVTITSLSKMVGYALQAEISEGVERIAGADVPMPYAPNPALDNGCSIEMELKSSHRSELLLFLKG
ncbi:hypothetical protein OPV22_029996 [Ensete ventricosum]|uniref:Pyruvate dehydrogenase E1 component subunit beta n=1 Tax=Ensete ventricosum TaxID=4639 RepID=A0AAV8Q7J0_ENSVE|nr:hypothetical protein OPV22_029996 [Ensete ventricosum]